MNLRERAIVDHKRILGDSSAGFGQELTITNPQGVALLLIGYASDVGEIVDPETQMLIQGRRATCTFDPELVKTAGMGTVVAVSEGSSKPWLVAFADAHGTTRTYKVIQVAPDQHLGSVRCELESYRAG